MPHPFQCIATVATEGGAYLLAACGPKLLSLSAKDGSIVSQWTSDAAVSSRIAWIAHGLVADPRLPAQFVISMAKYL